VQLELVDTQALHKTALLPHVFVPLVSPSSAQQLMGMVQLVVCFCFAFAIAAVSKHLSRT
jgi:hypothetical protein